MISSAKAFALICHSREGGNPVREMLASSVVAFERRVWVPASVGMTTGGVQ